MHDEEPPLPHTGKIMIGEDFHDLMHPIWRCSNRRLHLSRLWEYRWGPDLRAQTLCRIGRHKIIKTWKRRGDGPWKFLWTCRNCGYAPPLH